MKVRVTIHDVYEFDDEEHTLAELRRNGGELGEDVAKGYQGQGSDYFKGYTVTVSEVKNV